MEQSAASPPSKYTFLYNENQSKCLEYLKRMNLQRKSNGESYAPCTFPQLSLLVVPTSGSALATGTHQLGSVFLSPPPRNKPVEFLPSLATAVTPFSRDQVGIDV